MLAQDEILHRPKTTKDENFIYSTWLKSHRQMTFASGMSNSTYFYHHKQIVQSILSQPNVQVMMIVNKQDQDHLYGYSVVETHGTAKIIHYIYVKHTYRKLGLMKDLLAKEVPLLGQKLTFVTHECRRHKQIKDSLMLEYNPYILFSHLKK